MTTDRAARRRLRVFLGMLEVSGYYRNLRDGLRELGHAATLVELRSHVFQYGDGEDDRLVALVKAAHRRRSAASPAARAVWMPVEMALRLVLLLWAAARFDVFVFGFGTCITSMPRFELRLLRLLGRRVVCVFHGSDSRPPYLDGSLMARDRGATLDDCLALTRANRERVVTMGRLAHLVVDNPAAGHFHQRPFVSGYCLGVPMRGVTAAPAPAAERQSAVRVLHSPSHPEAKGTGRIVAAVEALRARGYEVDLVLITGRPNAEVLQEIARCDLVVDQLYSDTPMASLAAEAAACGKAVIVGGYAEEVFARYIPPELRAPSVYCHPDEFEATLEQLIGDAALRRRVAQRGREFITERWAPRAVAERYARLLRGDVPDAWLCDPADVRYVHGCCLPEARARELVRAVLERGGVAALQVDDKPALVERLVRFATQSDVEPVEAACSIAS